MGGGGSAHVSLSPLTFGAQGADMERFLLREGSFESGTLPPNVIHRCDPFADDWER